MTHLLHDIQLALKANKDLFYNTSGSKEAYQLGIKHISSAEFLGFALELPNGDLTLIKELSLVNFEDKCIKIFPKGSRISPIKLKFL